MMQRLTNTVLRAGLPLLFLSLAVGACDDSPTEARQTGPAHFSVHLTDAPGDLAGVWIKATDVVLVGGEDGQTSLLDEPTDLINILELQDRSTQLIQDAEVEPGTYGQLRFVLAGAVLETEKGEVYVQGDVEHPEGKSSDGDLKCPSCSQSGLKLSFRGGLNVQEGAEYELLLDFDAAHSFSHQAGRSGRWMMHPVIHVKVEQDGDDLIEPAGEIRGTVELGLDENDEPVTVPACGGQDRTLASFVPVATTLSVLDDEGNPLSFTGATAEDGTFEIQVLEEDDYELGFDEETVFDTEKLVWTVDPIEPDQVTIDAENDEVEGVSYTITDVSCEPVS